MSFRILTLGLTSKGPNILYNFKIPIYLQEEEVWEPLVPAVVLGTLLLDPIIIVHPRVVFAALTTLFQVLVADGAKMSAHWVGLFRHDTQYDLRD